MNNVNMILSRAHSLKSYVYWYGGKRTRCTDALLQRLSKAYPNIYTASYIAKCKADIKAGKSCCDCSGLVCYAYGISDIGSSQMLAFFKKWDKKPKNGMILYKKGHVGIYENGRILEMRGVDYDYQSSRTYKSQDWLFILYSPEVDYDTPTVHSIKPDYAQSFDTELTGTYTVNASSHIRQKATTSGESLAEVKKGDVVKCYGYHTDNWLLVVFGNVTGFIRDKYLTKGI